MIWARIAGQEIYFSIPLPELAFVQADRATSVTFTVPQPQVVVRRTRGWLANKQREIEVWSAPPGVLLRVEEGRDIYISPEGDMIIQVGGTGDVTSLESETLLGPALLLALASRGTWCLHASAVMYRGQVFVFLGESGRGKSTLAAFLAQTQGWTWVADDILPFTVDSSGVQVWPRFPQLKVPTELQPGLNLPEQIPVNRFIVLADPVEVGSPAVIQLMKQGQALQSLVSHTASTRLFDEHLLTKHLEDCAMTVRQLPVFELIYPRRMESLAHIKELLETSC